MFRTVVAEAAMSGHGTEALHEMVTAGAERLRRKAWAECESAYEALSPIQRAVLDTIAHLTPKYMPDAANAMAA